LLQLPKAQRSVPSTASTRRYEQQLEKQVRVAPPLHVHCSLVTPGCPGTSAEKQSVHPAVYLPRQPAG